MKERMAVIDGVRTPFGKMGGSLKKYQADDLAAFAFKALLLNTGFPAEQIDEVIMGNGAQSHTAANPARVAALKAGVPDPVTAYTVQRNCASGMQCLTSAADRLNAGEAKVIAAIAGESMSNSPLIFGEKMTDLFARLSRAKTMGQRLQLLASFRPAFLNPIISLEWGLTDPVCGLIMGKTAEILAREWQVTRRDQDEFALRSHQNAAKATEDGKLGEEIVRVPTPPKYDRMLKDDEGPRLNQNMEALQKLRPYFEKVTGTVTAGNSSQITDGGVATLVMTESHAKELGLTPLGYVREYAYAALEGERMGLGPVYATAKLLEKTGMQLSDFQLVEINEAFAAQVLACQRAFASDSFAQDKLGRASAIGELSPDILNVNGGAIALGHPVGATGTRLAVTLLKELRRRNQNCGLASLCVGGGQGASLALEVE
jgi:acetyl-CoA acetyltransferase family protein